MIKPILKIRTTLAGVIVIFALAILPDIFAVSPAPDGGYPNANTAEGDNALNSVTSGGANTAVGANTLFSLTTGESNTAVGSYALYSITTAGHNTAVGKLALTGNTSGEGNTANGSDALSENHTGNYNTATVGKRLDSTQAAAPTRPRVYQPLWETRPETKTWLMVQML